MWASTFPAGSQVEIRSSKAGLRGAWFEATVIEYLPKHRRYAVSYSSLVSDGDGDAKPLEETVYCANVRPRPPRSSSRAGFEFELHQLVEAFHNYGWWKGVVSKVLHKDGAVCNYCYRVSFPSSREEYEFKGEEVREQLQWVRLKGTWVPVQNQVQVGENVVFGMGSQVEVSRDSEYFGVAWFDGTILKVIGKRNFLVEYESLILDDAGSSGMLLKEIVDLQYIRPSPPPASEFNSFDIFEEVEAFHKNGRVACMVSNILPGSRYLVKSKHQEVEIELDQTALRPHFNWTNEQWVHISQDKSSKSSASRGPKSTGCRQKTRSVKSSKFHFSAPTFSNNDGEAVGGSDLVNVKVNKSEWSIVEGGIEIFQHCKKLKKGKLLEEKLNVVDENKQTSLPVKDKKVEEPTFKNMFNFFQPCKKSKKGKPLEEDWQMIDDTLMDCGSETPNMVDSGYFTANLGNCGPIEKAKIRRKKVVIGKKKFRKPTKNPDIDVKQHAHVQEEMKECKTSSPPKNKTPIDPAPSEVQIVIEMETSINGTSNEHNEFTSSRPLSEKAPIDPNPHRSSLSRINGVSDHNELAPSRSQTMKTSVEMKALSDPILNWTSPSNLDICDHYELIPNACLSEKAGTENKLPFTKESTVWGTIELMEVFQIMPQKPHFQLLYMHNEEAREGMAIGFMVTFANLVDSIKKLKITDSQDSFERKSEALIPLESNGFNVHALRSCLENLLAIRNNASQSMGKKISLKGKIVDGEKGKCELDQLIDRENHLIFQLEKNLNYCQERREFMLLIRDNTDSEVTQLKVDLRATEEAYLSAQVQFDIAINALR